jgi:hypothetical protein
MSNPGFNFGIFREGYDLVVERRKTICRNDTTFFRVWNITSQYNYRIAFSLKNLALTDVTAVLEDSYLGTEKSLNLNDTTNYDFKVDANAASADQFRFKVVFRKYVAPLSITRISATRKTHDALVEWSVENETSIDAYVIEHSTDGINFQDIQRLPASNTTPSRSYSYKQVAVSEGGHYYRIRSITTTGKILYSTIAKIDPVFAQNSINVYPNPVANKILQLEFNKQPAGKYNVEIISANGLRQQLAGFQLNAGQSAQTINLPQGLASGIYQLQLFGPGNLRIVKAIKVL